MAKVTIEIDLSNDAFGARPEYELGRIFRKYGDPERLGVLLDDAGTQHPQSILDSNGNSVGSITVELDEE